MLRGHIHTDAIHILTGAAGTLLVFHAMRGGGAWLASKGMVGLGTTLGGLATFGGA